MFVGSIFKYIILIYYYGICCMAFEDFIFAGQEVVKEVMEKGKGQYQLLQERGRLPKYGSCWKAAVVSVEEGCRFLSEDTQSDMALRMTNCFLEMSGHETYNCELDKKPNLKEICISSMTDRAFNVYTEFYTHVQNICWFLRGQVWQEIMSENSLKVSKQIEDSVKNQEVILESQRQSLQLQEKLLEYGGSLEKIMKDFQASTQHHEKALNVMVKSLGSLQSWLIGELSWFELSIFYISVTIFVGIFTSSVSTIDARLPILILLGLSIIAERFLCSIMSLNIKQDVKITYTDINYCVWLIRKVFMLLSVFVIFYKAYYYENVNKLQNNLLQNVYNQNLSIGKNLTNLDNNFQKHFNNYNDNVSFIYEDLMESTLNNSAGYNSFSNDQFKYKEEINNTNSNTRFTKNQVLLVKNSVKVENKANTRIYNLRSKQNTPEIK